ncbi:MAG: glycoside hydrolase family 18 [Bacteroidales bacterium]|uniref:glycoside hydrolase family 18 n=1 Tax=Porphyromonas sp. TaxID=1924944 RepID=UPI0029723694|nr:glycoside hydrolase family 18 [Porphyromonas sp.]MDD7438262.1 glycoside hydrolase family 18 [Bacteroidales bacterium]MDY3066687.1 glycoside hydrolase family 18 [Porphyromonas sp.]
MKKIHNIYVVSLLLGLLLSMGACTNVQPLDLDDSAQAQLLERDTKKWAEEKAAHDKNLADSARIAEENARLYAAYLEDLRAYKKTDHLLMFGWFASWNPTSPDKTFTMDHMPDSVDFISNWGPWNNLSEPMKADLAKVQAKGTRVTIGWIIENVGDGVWNIKPQLPDDPYKAIDMYVQALCDSIAKYNYDGMDIDYEPSFASPFKNGNHCGDWSEPWSDNKALISCSATENKELENYFFREMRKKLPKEKMLNINGSLDWLDPEVYDCFNYFVAQSYNNTGARWYNSVSALLQRKGLSPQQIIITESFQTNKGNADRFVNNYAKYAKTTVNGNIGGIGAFHINEDWLHSGYKNLREAIQVMNPAFKE